MDRPPARLPAPPIGRDPIAFIRDAAPPVPPMRPELQILQSLRRIIRAAEIFSKQLIRQHKITGPQLMCLRKLMESEGLTVSELSKAIYLSPSTVVGILDRLEERGLVARLRSRGDRRKVLIHPTQAGRELVAEAPSPLQVALERGLQALEPEQQQRMAESFSQLVQMLELDFVDAAPVLETGPLDSAFPEEESGGV